MRLRLIGPVLAVCILGSAVQAADVTVVTRQIQPTRAIARLADQGLGYSVLHQALSGPQSSYRVHVTCTIDESFVQAFCPTPAYEAHCPSARIVCR